MLAYICPIWLDVCFEICYMYFSYIVGHFFLHVHVNHVWWGSWYVIFPRRLDNIMLTYFNLYDLNTCSFSYS